MTSSCPEQFGVRSTSSTTSNFAHSVSLRKANSNGSGSAGRSFINEEHDTHNGCCVCCMVVLVLLMLLTFIVSWSAGWIEPAVGAPATGMSLSVLLGAALIPEMPKRQPTPRWKRIVGIAVVAAVTAIVLAYPWYGFPLQVPLDNGRSCSDYWQEWLMGGAPTPGDFDRGPVWEYAADVVALIVITPLVFACLEGLRQPSSYAQNATWFVLISWWFTVVWTLEDEIDWCGKAAKNAKARNWRDIKVANKVVAAHGKFLDAVIVFWAALLVLRRAQQLEASSGRRLLPWMSLNGSWKIYCVTGALGMCCFAGLLQRYVHSYQIEASEWWLIASGASFVVVVVILLGFAVVLGFAFSANLTLLRDETRRVEGAAKTEALWAAGVLRRELAAGLVAAILTAVYWFTLAIAGVLEFPKYSEEYYWWKFVAQRVVHVIDPFGIAILSGAVAFTADNRRVEVPKPKLTIDTERSLPSERGATDMQVWSQKVEELAKRGFPLSALLSFLEELLAGKVMPGFCPMRSTTADVVRRAIIPMSRDTRGGGRALATIWQNGTPAYAERMVTHNWNNVFLHLVAAVVADGLAIKQYEAIAERLVEPGGIEEIREALAKRGTLGVTLWLCAFSVNQHASICGGFGPPPAPHTAEFNLWQAKQRDSVTQEPFTLCRCSEPKYFNDQPDVCELNKFEDMMSLLSKRVEHFAHIVVVDEIFDVFSRAWCVAEVVEGSALHLAQSIVIHSDASLEVHYDSLTELDIRNCSASRVEDKQAILANVNIEEFNAHLQWLVFGTEGLFRDFADGLARAAAVGRIVRRATRSLEVRQTTPDEPGKTQRSITV